MIFSALAVQLDKHTVGYLTYNAGLQSSMSCVLEHSTDKQHVLITCSVGIPHSFISASYTKKLTDYELKLRLAAKYVYTEKSYTSQIIFVYHFYVLLELAHLDTWQNMVQKKKSQNTVLLWLVYLSDNQLEL